MKESINRRKLILGGAATGIVGAAGLAAYGIHESKKASEEVSKKESKPELKDAPPAPVQ